MTPEGAPQDAFSNLVGVGAESLVRNASRLGLTWRLRLATVTTGGVANFMIVRFDGDDGDVTVVSIIGSRVAGTRVYVITVPPAGNFVIGQVSADNPLVQRFWTAASGSLTLGAVATLIPGCTLTVDIGDFEYEVTGVFDMDETVLGTSIGVGELFVDGVVASTTIAAFEMTTANHRATVTQQWSGSVTGGSSHTLELRGRRSAASGTQVIQAVGTTMRAHIYA